MRRTPPPTFTLPPATSLVSLGDATVRQCALEVLTRTGIRYNDEQLAFILAPSTATAVVAGAGSGKTATMVGRVVVMSRVLGIPLDDIQVISFTGKSADEFRERLGRALLRVDGGDDSDPDELTKQMGRLARTVSTFHSAAYHQARRLGLLTGDIFEFAGKDRDEEEDRNAPTIDTKLTPVMIETMREAYWQAHREVAGFADLTREMEAEADRQLWYAIRKGQEPHALTNPTRWQELLDREYLYQRSDAKQDDLADVSAPQRQDPWWQVTASRLSGVEAARQVPFAVRPPSDLGSRAGRGSILFATFKVGDLYVHVERQFLDAERRRRSGNKLAFHERDRRVVIARCSDNPNAHMFLQARDFQRRDGGWALTPPAERRLMEWLHLPGSVPDDHGPGPEIKLPGDLRSVPLPELLFHEGAFIEAQAVRIEDFPNPAGRLEAMFVETLRRYWPVLDETIRRRGYVRFGTLLGALRVAEHLQPLATSLPGHLLIDEFQDISLELLLWVRRWLEVVTKEGREVSVTAIGDPWQAIYSWRGSHPLFLEQFHHFFPSSSRSALTLRTNYRSRQGIIDLGETVLRRSPQDVQRRHGLSAIAEAPDWPAAVAFGERIRRRTDLGQDRDDTQAAIQRAASYLGHLLTELPAEAFGSESEPIVLFELRRTTSDGSMRLSEPLRQQVVQAMKGDSRSAMQGRRVSAQRLTFHRAKGLEAHFVVVVGDSFFTGEHPLRDHALRVAAAAWRGEFPILAQLGTYTAVGEDEVRRLMYVALTRAKLGLLWVPLASEDGEVSGGGCFQLAAQWAGHELTPPQRRRR